MAQLQSSAITGSLVISGSSTLTNYGSTKFGDTSDDVHQFTGSLQITSSGGANAIFLKTNSSLIRWSNGTYIGQDSFYTALSDLRLLTFDGSAVQTRLHINANDGNVGIGTTSPSEKLEVVGDTIISGSIVQRSTNGIVLYDSSGFGGGSIHGSYGMYNGEIFIQPGATGAKVTFSRNGSVTVGGTNSFANDYVGNTLAPDHGLVVSGSVGIGTKAPLARLHLFSNTHSDFLDNGILIDVSSSDEGEPAIAFRNQSDMGSNYWIAGINEGLPNLDFAYGSSFTTATTKVTFHNNGNVGIGTASPSSKLHIKGSGTTDSTTALRVDDGNGDDTFIVRDDGNVGIGTTSPTDLLHIRKDQNAPTQIKVENTSNTSNSRASITVGSAGNAITMARYLSNYTTVSSWANRGGILTDSGLTNGFFFRTSAGAISFQPGSNTDSVVFDTSGNVGIGTTSPQAELHVIGNISASNNLYVDGTGNFTDNLIVSGTFEQQLLESAIDDDLDNIQSVRFFRSHTETKNVPEDISSFGMGISLAYGPTNTVQLLTSRGSNTALYMRKQTNSTFSSWIKLRDENQISDTDISNWDDGYSKWAPNTTGDFNYNSGSNQFLNGHVSTLNYPSDPYFNINQSFLSGIAPIYSSGNGWQLVSSRGFNAGLAYRKVSNGNWGNWRYLWSTDNFTTSSINNWDEAYSVINNGGTISGSLTVEGRADFQNDLRLRGTDSAANQGVTRFYVDNTNQFHIDTTNDGSNLFVIDGSGNVGIGNLSPSEQLDVTGNATISGNITASANISASGDLSIEGFPSVSASLATIPTITTPALLHLTSDREYDLLETSSIDWNEQVLATPASLNSFEWNAGDSGSRIYFKEDGYYEVTSMVTYYISAPQNNSKTRLQLKNRIRVDGTTYLSGSDRGTYARGGANSLGTASSTHFYSPFYIDSASYIESIVDYDGGGDGPLYLDPKQSLFTVKKL